MNLIQFKKEDSLKRKIVVSSILILAFIMLIGIIFYVNKLYNHPSWLLASVALMRILFMLGLLLKSKFIRWTILLFAYILVIYPFIFSSMMLLFPVGEFVEKALPIHAFTHDISAWIIIYLFSNNEAQKIYEVKNFKKELMILLPIALVLAFLYANNVYEFMKLSVLG